MEIIKTQILKLKTLDSYAEISADGYSASIFILVQDVKSNKIHTELIESFDEYERYMTYGKLETFAFWKQKVVNTYNLGNDIVERLFKYKDIQPVQHRILQSKMKNNKQEFDTILSKKESRLCK